MRQAPRQRGFALLLVFAMAAGIAILLYTEMPRVAFEAQRNREQMLIDRGEQYQRAIQLYVRKIQRYPARIEDLESTNNIRFLRRRYPDPMTGKDDWRLVHVGPGGILLDSKVQKPASPTGDKDKEEKKPESTFITQAPQVGSTTIAGQPGAEGQSPATVRRASDRPAMQASAFGAMSGGMIGGVVAVDPNAPHPQTPTYPIVPPGQYPGMQPGQYPPGVQPGQYPGMQPGQYPGVQPGQYPGIQPGQTPGLQPGIYPGVPVPGQMAPFPQPGAQAPVAFPAQPQQPPGAAPANPALDLIRNLLTSPRQGPGAGTAVQAAGMQLGGGIAGVASKYEAEGIKVYNEKTAYDEWEFIYDPKNDRALAGGVAMGAIGGGIQGAPGQGGAGPPPGTFGPGQRSGGFGTQPAMQPPMQQPGFGFPPAGQPGMMPRPGPGRGR